jgi:hypothetical protein
VGIEKKMKRGTLFQFPKTTAGTGAGVHNKGCLDQTVGDSAKEKMAKPKKPDDAAKQGNGPPVVRYDAFATKQRRISTDTNPTKAHRNFIWLPWMEGAVNYAEQQGRDVLSGPFSGCYMIRYREGGGAWRVAHVHTPGAIDDWNELAAKNGFEIDAGFKPYVRKADEGNADKWYGLITDDGLCYRIWAGGVEYGRIDQMAPLRRIKLIAHVPSIEPADLRVLAPLQ